MAIDNFMYRILDNEVIKVNQLIPSYTVMNQDKNLNFTRFEYSDDLKTFIERSLKSSEESVNSKELLHTALDLSESEVKKYVFITSIPWLDFTSIQHPVRKFSSADIPSIAWGKFRSTNDGKLQMPFSVQAHHGFVDGHHIRLLAEELEKNLKQEIGIGQ